MPGLGGSCQSPGPGRKFPKSKLKPEEDIAKACFLAEIAEARVWKEIGEEIAEVWNEARTSVEAAKVWGRLGLRWLLWFFILLMQPGGYGAVMYSTCFGF